MPIYEYQCEACQRVTDVRHGFQETPSEPCPACGGHLKRLFTPAGIVFKGSGFYVNDSRKKSSGSSGDSKSEAPKADAGKSDAPKADAPKTDAPKTEAPKTSGGSGDAAA